MTRLALLILAATVATWLHNAGITWAALVAAVT